MIFMLGSNIIFCFKWFTFYCVCKGLLIVTDVISVPMNRSNHKRVMEVRLTICTEK